MVDPVHLLGVGLAMVAAVSAASNRIFIRTGTARGTASEAYFVVMTVSALVVIPAVAVGYYPAYGLTGRSLLSFAGAGIVGTLLGNLLMYTSIARIGASRTAPIVTSNALVSVGLAAVVLGEPMAAFHGLGVVVIVVGVAVIAWETAHDPDDARPSRQIRASLLLPFVAAFAYGTEPIFATFGFAEGTPPMVGLAVKTAAAWLGFVGYTRWRGTLASVVALRGGNRRWFALAGLANVGFLVGYYAGLSLAPVNVVVPIIATNTLFVIVLSALFLPRRLERVTWRLAVAAVAVVAGAIIVTVFG